MVSANQTEESAKRLASRPSASADRPYRRKRYATPSINPVRVVSSRDDRGSHPASSRSAQPRKRRGSETADNWRSRPTHSVSDPPRETDRTSGVLCTKQCLPRHPGNPRRSHRQSQRGSVRMRRPPMVWDMACTVGWSGWRPPSVCFPARPRTLEAAAT